MNKELSTQLKQEIFDIVKDTKYITLATPALENNDINALRVYLSDYIEDITPAIRPLFNTDTVNEWNNEVTTYQKVYNTYNQIMSIILPETKELVVTLKENGKTA